MIFKRTFNHTTMCTGSGCTNSNTSSAVLSSRASYYARGSGSIGEGSIRVMPYELNVPQSYVNNVTRSRAALLSFVD